MSKIYEPGMEFEGKVELGGSVRFLSSKGGMVDFSGKEVESHLPYSFSFTVTSEPVVETENKEDDLPK